MQPYAKPPKPTLPNIYETHSDCYTRLNNAMEKTLCTQNA